MATGMEAKTIRGYRPSDFASESEREGEAERKATNIEIYARRAAFGLPIFSEEVLDERREGDGLERV